MCFTNSDMRSHSSSLLQVGLQGKPFPAAPPEEHAHKSTPTQKEVAADDHDLDLKSNKQIARKPLEPFNGRPATPPADVKIGAKTTVQASSLSLIGVPKLHAS